MVKLAFVLLLLGQLLYAGGASGQPPAADYVAGELLVGFRPEVDEVQAESTYRGHGGIKLEKLRGVNIHRIKVPDDALESIAQALARRPEVEFVEVNWRLAPQSVANDPYFTDAWHLAKIGAPSAWDIPQRTTITVAVIDSGVDGSHPDLAAKMVPGYNFYSNTTNATDATGHGTAVAGVVGAITNNGVGVASVAPHTRIMPIRTSDSTGFSYASAIVNGMTWAVDHGAKVINISINKVAGVSSITSAAQYVRNKGGVVVAAAGNCGCFDSTPENPYLISVSATLDATDVLASWSSRGNYIDIAAPGNYIWTTIRGGGYMRFYGTSVASPVVSGVVALMMGANPTLSPASIETMLKANADDRGAAGRDSSYGYGRVNAYRAVAAAAGVAASTTDGTKPTVSITSPTAGSTVKGLIAVAASASDNTGVSRVDLYVDGQLYVRDTATPFSFSWDTTRVGNGSHTLVAKAYDASGNEGVSGALTVNVSNVAADTTRPVVSITSPASGATVSGIISVAMTASDNVGLARVDLYVDGQLHTRDTTAPFAASWDTTKVANGGHTLVARAYDTAGNEGVSATVTITVSNLVADATRPLVTITSPAAGATVSGMTGVTMTASDNLAVARVDLYVDGQRYAWDTTSPFTASWDTTRMANGSHTLVARAYDAAGNEGVSSAVSVTVRNSTGDVSAPSAQITSSYTIGSFLRTDVSATDNVGVVRLDFYVDGTLLSSSTSSSAIFTVYLGGLSSGTHRVWAKAYDAAGNVGTSSTVSFTK